MLDSRGTVWLSGSNKRSQCNPLAEATDSSDHFRELDLSSLAGRALPEAEWRPVLITAAWETTFICMRSEDRDDVILVFGANDWDEHGTGDAGEQSSLRCISFAHLKSPQGSACLRVEALASGPRNIVASLSSDDGGRLLLVGWGSARHGQLGLDLSGKRKPPRTMPKPTLISSYDSGQNVQIAVGREHTAMLVSDNKARRQVITLRGHNKHGQLCAEVSNEAIFEHELNSALLSNWLGADVRQELYAKSVSATWSGTYLVLSDYTILAWGANSHHQLGQGPDFGDAHRPAVLRLPRILDLVELNLVAGSEHLLAKAKRRDGSVEVWAWGWNEHGNLGLGHTRDVCGSKTYMGRKRNELDFDRLGVATT
ncbi:hypothetical protein OIV83_000226 [Microbotryomycetes sp. JL201]|nr:hypothetical protein OIV83_000226 [Microbotryomycetes sp. JL201]